MATFKAGRIGEIADRVRLKLHHEDVLIAEQYEVSCSLFRQPATFSITVGHAGTAAQLIKKYPVGSPFQLFIGDVPQFTGVLDDPSAESTTNGTSVTFRGRDASAPLHDDHIDSERTFKDDTYLSLAKKQLEAVGLGDRAIATSNRANRKVKGGVPIQELSAPARTVEQILTHAAGAPGVIHQQIQARLNEKRYEFLLRYLQLAGLFFWAAADGSFVLSEPNTKQAPVSSILRRVGMSRNETNVISGAWQDYTSNRFSKYEVYGRGTGGKNGHAKALGEYIDDEMTARGFVKRKIWRSQNARTKEQATFLARRMCAEDRRNGSNLRYTVAGHTTPFTGGGQRAVWTPDTIVRIDDEIFGVHEPMYLTDCTYRCSSSGTTTDIVLQSPNDQVYGPGEF